MLKFFRKIRQKFLLQDRVTRYLVYAIGEIFLVVIGILIALQVNNWNEDRKTKAAEQKLLASLLEEFDSNAVILDQTMELNEQIITNSTQIGDFTGPSIGDFDELALSNLMVGTFKFESRFVPNQGTIEETINTGKLSILSNPELRKAITNWKSDLERVKRQEDYVVARRDLAHDYFINSGNFRRHLEVIDESLIEAGTSRFPSNNFKFLQDQGFESKLYLFIVASANLNQVFYPPLKARTETIISLIKEKRN
ncbi:DUF6090 family protein [Algoriphagus hitonicola]|uniref:Uncharacterized protein n=1 Tax=Algoriphagus hitonicola TaxID=435880 RepID=A0A1I2Q1L1_9BACT|nr:DUF6090 family protein [Algoriphagus hitonicola]SFG22385.1 hypothetical protein SAMN04487988_10278 [Algoriphagus hitonicola]